MIRNYLRIAVRNLLKNKSFSFITVVGLSVGITAFLLIVQYIRFERSYEDSHKNSANIYRITLDLYKGSEYLVTDCETHAPMGPMLKEKMPEVKDFVRMFHFDGLQDIRIRDEKFLDEGVYYADQSVFNVFSLNVVQGDQAKALTVPYTAMISESMARKFYGDSDPLGKVIQVDNTDYTISAVMQDLPPNTHLKFKILVSHTTLTSKNGWYKENEWNGNNEYTYLLMAPGTNLKVFNEKLQKLSADLKDKLNNARYTAQPMRDIHLYSNKTYEPEANGNARTVYFLLIISGFIILIAWVNYINLSTSRAMERAREVGIRKVMGSLKSQLIRQFLAESVLINLLAGSIALLLFIGSIPSFRNLTAQPLGFGFYQDINFWLLFAGLMFTGSLLAGIYPAFVLSSFQPAAVLKGKFQTSAHGQVLRKSLVVFQFGATVVLLICMSTVYLQIQFLRTTDLGVKTDQTLVIRSPRINKGDSVFVTYFNSFRSKLLERPDVELVTRSGSLPGLSLHELSTTGVAPLGKGPAEEFYFYGVDADFLKTMRMTLVAGRDFESGVLNQDQVIVNEEAVKRLGFKSAEAAIGEKLTFQTRWPGEPAHIIGVMKNFYQRSPKEAHIPMLFQYRDASDYFSVRLRTGDMKASMAAIHQVWKEVYPDFVYNSFFLDDHYNQQYQSDVQFGKVMAIFSILAVFIACLGLFGLSSYTIVQRTREIGIRKVLGASVGEIVRLLSEDFAKVVLISAILAIPIAYFAMSEWLSHYSVRMSFNVWMFVLPVVLILFIALFTVSFQTIKTALANPVNALKQD